MTKIKMTVLLGIVFMTAASLTAVAEEKDILREVQDRAQIKELMWQYARALDTGDAEAYAATFTEDGQFGRGDNAVKGQEALLKMMGSFRKRPQEGQQESPQMPRMYHMTTNYYIEFTDKDHAVFHEYWVTFTTGGGPDTQTQIAGVGRGVNELVRVDGRWLIQVRDIMPRD